MKCSRDRNLFIDIFLTKIMVNREFSAYISEKRDTFVKKKRMTLTEIVGWLATLVVFISFSQKSMTRLRMISIVACLMWSWYGYLKSDMPIIVTNGSIIFIHLWALLPTHKKSLYLGILKGLMTKS